MCSNLLAKIRHQPLTSQGSRNIYEEMYQYGLKRMDEELCYVEVFSLWVLHRNVIINELFWLS